MASKEIQNVISLLWKFRESAKDITIELVRTGMDQLGMMGKPPKDMKNVLITARNVPAVWITTPNS